MALRQDNFSGMDKDNVDRIRDKMDKDNVRRIIDNVFLWCWSRELQITKLEMGLRLGLKTVYSWER